MMIASDFEAYLMNAPKTTQPATINTLTPKAASHFSPRRFHAPQDQQLEEKKENKTGLPDGLKAGIENLSGMSLDDVKVHYNSDKPSELDALAYTQGTNIHVAPGQQKYLPHEAWHVVQQKQGRVTPILNLKGNVNVNDNAGLEREASVMGLKALHPDRTRHNDRHYPVASSHTKGTTVQRVISYQAGMIKTRETLLEKLKVAYDQNVHSRIEDLVQGYEKEGQSIDASEVYQKIIDTLGKEGFKSMLAAPGFSKFLHDRGEHGVLVYGTENARESYRGQKHNPELPSGFMEKGSGQPEGIATKGYFTADRYSNFSWRDFKYKGKAEFSIFQPAYQDDLNKQYGGKRAEKTSKIRSDLEAWSETVVGGTDKEKVRKYQKALLDHPRYSPLVTFFESDSQAASKEKMKTSGGKEDAAKAKFQLQTRRASKFGIEYMKSIGGGVAFIREVESEYGKRPTDSEFTVNKGTSANRPGGRMGEARVPITVSEERFSYRVRKGHSGLVHFLGGQQDKAPWDDHPASWQKYDKHRAEKYQHLALTLGIDYQGKSPDEIKMLVEKALRLKYPDLSMSEAMEKIRSPRSKL